MTDPTPVAAPLDVERLRNALVRADEVMGERYPETFPLDLTNTGWPRFAEAIAREYAALLSPDTETAGEAGDGL